MVWRCLVTDRRNGDLGADGTREPTAGLLMATFDHHTSRELDPQLHTHVFIFNLAPRKDRPKGLSLTDRAPC
ncbi:MAG: relaxase domain-containing protein [Hyphomicrobiaceae bacterium]